MNEDDTPVIVSNVFPNPARDHFNLRFIKPSNAAQAFCLQLYNSSGILVKLQPMNRLQDIQHINIIGLAPGVYYFVRGPRKTWNPTQIINPWLVNLWVVSFSARVSMLPSMPSSRSVVLLKVFLL